MGDMLSQNEIDALLKGVDSTEDNDAIEAENEDLISIDDLNNSEYEMPDEVEMNEAEKDALGEIGNISMGTAATTFSTLLNNKVVITTPIVKLTTIEDLANDYPDPFIAVKVEYKEGILGSNLLVLKEDDVKKIADIMMGGDGSNTEGEISELHLSAIAEAMNQMIGSSATSLSSMFNKKVDILPPQAFVLDFKNASEQLMDLTGNSQNLVKISFKMEVGDIINSEMLQVLPMPFAKNLVEQIMPQGGNEQTSVEYNNVQQSPSSVNNQAPIQQQQPPIQQPVTQQQYPQQPPMQQVPYQQQYMAPPQQAYQQPVMQQQYVAPVDVRSVQFQSFDQGHVMGGNESIDLIREVPLEITVELGRTKKTIKEILEFNAGTVIELEKLSGEAVDILVNGKYIAKGEVVVIDENYGIRITDIVKQANRI